jgi:MurNAc alpha-1-phosphate uridylyltransferase
MSARNLDAVILAAGRGQRMRPLSDHTPKPLLMVRGKRLIEWHLEALARARVKRVVINTAWLEEQFEPVLGDGFRWGLSIRYSHEGRDHGGALDTAGGIAKVLPWLGDSFWVVSGDVFIPNFRFDAADADRFAAGNRLGQLWMAPNAPHHPMGDFAIDAEGLAVLQTEQPRRTWASVGLFHAELFAGIVPGTPEAITPLLHEAIAQRRLGAQPWDGGWTDVGTPERLAALNSAA